MVNKYKNIDFGGRNQENMPRYELSLITRALKNVSMWKIIQVFFLVFCLKFIVKFPLKNTGGIG